MFLCWFCRSLATLEEETTDDADDFPIPVYFQQNIAATKDDPNSNDNDNDDDGIVSMGKNLFYLRDKTDNKLRIFEINVPNHTQPLLVGSCPQHVRAGTAEVQQQQQCDILLSLDWPQGMEDVLNVDTEPLSYDVAEVAVQCRPRYHICPSTQLYHASPPYSLPNSDHVGRFLALAPVTTAKPTKTTKFIHALGLEPLKANPPPTTAPSTLPCPFLAQPTTNSVPTKQSKPALPEFARQAQSNGPSTAYSMFAKPTNKRQRQNKNGDDDNEGSTSNSLQPPDDPNICTLFLYGLHKDVTGQLQSTTSPKVLLAFSKYGCTKVRHPPNAQTSTYCFIEFPTQAKALECILDCQGAVTIDNVDLTLKWAAPKQQQQTRDNNPNKRQRREEQQHFVTQEEAKDSTTLYFHPPKTNNIEKKSNENDDNKDNPTDEAPPSMEEDFAEKLREYLEKCLEDALNEGVGEDEERVTAETEPALKVEVRTKEQYGFLEFASHAAATMALAAVTKSTDGGSIIAEPDGAPAPTASLVGTTLRWAKGAPPPKKKGNREEVLEALGMKRQYYPADNRTDCWFCLSSPSCETHLITGVYDEWYAAMPKGPVHPGHILLVPITHTNEGAWNLDKEWIQLVDKLQQHAAQAYDMDLFVFERAMETKGGYHTHIQCVPVPRDSITTLQGTMMAHAKASGFDLRPIQSDLGVKAMINKDDSYFYAEVRTRSQNYRFLYSRDNSDEGAANVPLQFAREVLASVLKNPKLAHWKACVVDKEQETQITSEFRTSFNDMS